jgi:hypothetical protein
MKNSLMMYARTNRRIVCLPYFRSIENFIEVRRTRSRSSSAASSSSGEHDLNVPAMPAPNGQQSSSATIGAPARSFTCSCCNSQFVSKERLSMHRLRVHATVVTSDGAAEVVQVPRTVEDGERGENRFVISYCYSHCYGLQ